MCVHVCVTLYICICVHMWASVYMYVAVRDSLFISGSGSGKGHTRTYKRMHAHGSNQLHLLPLCTRALNALNQL